MLVYLKYLPLVVVLIIYLARMLEVRTKRVLIKGPIQEKTTFRLFMLSGLIVLVGGCVEYYLRGMQFNIFLLILGIFLAVISFTIRRAAIKALGQFWSLHIEMRENHQFVQNGPFQWVRHPTYFSMILELLSGILICQAWFSGVVAFFIFIPAMLRRLKFEEIALNEKFGEAYQVYSSNTPKIIPFRFNAK